MNDWNSLGPRYSWIIYSKRYLNRVYVHVIPYARVIWQWVHENSPKSWDYYSYVLLLLLLSSICFVVFVFVVVAMPLPNPCPTVKVWRNRLILPNYVFAGRIVGRVTLCKMEDHGLHARKADLKGDVQRPGHSLLVPPALSCLVSSPIVPLCANKLQKPSLLAFVLQGFRIMLRTLGWSFCCPWHDFSSYLCWKYAAVKMRTERYCVSQLRTEDKWSACGREFRMSAKTAFFAEPWIWRDPI